MWSHSSMLDNKWVRVLPHLIDSILLASAIGLTLIIQQYPIQNGWLSAKTIALVLYILFGTIALKRGKTLRLRQTAFVMALLVVSYIVAVAHAHNPWPF